MTSLAVFMRNGVLIAITLYLMAVGAYAQGNDAGGGGNAEDKTIIFQSDDPEMEVAIAKARETLTEFWAAFEAPASDVGRFSLKVAISEADQPISEHVWVGSLERKDDGAIVGTIDNEPNHLKSVAFGERYRFNVEQISDWMFYRRGKIVGGHTIRPMLERLPADRAAAIRRMLESP